MRAPLRVWMLLLGLLLGEACRPATAADTNQLMRLLESRSCQGCRLQDADLVQADLRDAGLKGALLQRANLSGARLDGADLRGANLSFTSLAGASLREADLRGSELNGTDLRQADLSGALLDAGSLSRTHWDQARGIEPIQHSYAELHNAGVAAAQQGRYPEAESFFGEAIRRQPEAAISWVARGISRAEQGKTQEASQDFVYASELYKGIGDLPQAQELSAAAMKLKEPEKKPKAGNGLASSLAAGALSAFQLLAPIALKAFTPAMF